MDVEVLAGAEDGGDDESEAAFVGFKSCSTTVGDCELDEPPLESELSSG